MPAYIGGGALHPFRVIPEEPQPLVACATQKRPYTLSAGLSTGATCVVVVNHQAAVVWRERRTNGACAALCGQQRVVVLRAKTVQIPQRLKPLTGLAKQVQAIPQAPVYAEVPLQDPLIAARTVLTPKLIPCVDRMSLWGSLAGSSAPHTFLCGRRVVVAHARPDLPWSTAPGLRAARYVRIGYPRPVALTHVMRPALALCPCGLETPVFNTRSTRGRLLHIDSTSVGLARGVGAPPGLTMSTYSLPFRSVAELVQREVRNALPHGDRPDLNGDGPKRLLRPPP